MGFNSAFKGLILILILSSNLRLVFPSGVVPSGFLNKILHSTRFTPLRASRLTHLTLLDLIMLLIFSEQCYLRSLSLYELLHPSIHLWRYSLFRALASLTRHLHSSLFAALLLHPLIPSSCSASI